MSEVAGDKLAKLLAELEEPIHEALVNFEELTDWEIQFDKHSAVKLGLTPEESNSARSKTSVISRLADWEAIGDLFVIAFMPEDGTGKSGQPNTLESIDDIEWPYPVHPKVLPRGKESAHTEAHLTILTHKIGDVHADAVLFGGTFDLLGLVDNSVRKIGELGQVPGAEITDLSPVTTLTVGYRPGERWPERFGDPHAVYNDMPQTLQVCGFLAITNAMAERHAGTDLLAALQPQFPRAA